MRKNTGLLSARERQRNVESRIALQPLTAVQPVRSGQRRVDAFVCEQNRASQFEFVHLSRSVARALGW
jgi:hypothetical protein